MARSDSTARAHPTSWVRAFLCAGALTSALTCVTGTEPPETNPVPRIVTLYPSTVVAGRSSSVVITGEAFAPGAEGLWNGSERPTVAESSNRLRVSLDAADVSAPGTGVLAVRNPEPGGGLSQALTLVIGNPAPVLDSVSPAVAVALESAPPIRAYGRDFTDADGGSWVVFDAAAVPATYVSDSELTFSVPDYLLTSGRSASVSVSNPSPGGGASASTPFDVVNPSPTILAVSPDSIRRREAADVTLSGSGFVWGTTVWMDGVEFVPSYLSPTSIVFRIPTSGPSRGGLVHVESPAPGGGPSNVVAIGVQEVQPSIRGTWPLAVEADAGAQSLLLLGGEFAPDAAVLLDGVQQPVTYVGVDSLEIVVPSGAVGSVAARELVVVNPRGGGASPPRPLAVVPAGRIAYSNLWGSFVTSRLTGLERIDVDFEAARADWIDTWPTGDDVLYTKAVGFFDQPGVFRTTPGGAELQITDDQVHFPRVSSDGAWIYFVRSNVIWRMRPDGSGLESVVAGTAEETVRWPDPSPSGDRLLYTVYGTPRTLRILDLATQQVTSYAVEAYDARWSPDGEWIAYRMNTNRLHRIRPDWTGNEQLTSVTFGPGGFDWSPDSRFLIGVRGSFNELTYSRIYLIEPETGLTLHYPSAVSSELSYPEVWAISWYPDPGAP